MRKNCFKRIMSAMMASVMVFGMMVPVNANNETEDAVDLSNVRFAVSADGNAHDEDDWAATAATLGIFATLGMEENLVHYDVGSHVWFCERCSGTDYHADELVKSNEEFAAGFGVYEGDVLDYGDQMYYTMSTALELFGYDMDYLDGYGDPDVDKKYFNDHNNLDGAVANLAEEIEKSTEDDRLYMVMGGPAEVFYLALEQATQGQDYVTIITHSNWNNNHKLGSIDEDGNVTVDACLLGTYLPTHTLFTCPDEEELSSDLVVNEDGTPWVDTSEKRYFLWEEESHSLSDLIAAFPDVEIVGIDDQNAGSGGGDGFQTDEIECWDYMKDSENLGWQFVYKRMHDNSKYDISDTGMTYFLLRYLQDGYVLNQDSWTYSGTSLVEGAGKVYTEYNYDDYSDFHQWLYDMDAIDSQPSDYLPDVYTVTFDTNGGDALVAQEVEEENAMTAVTPVKDGYTFVEWQLDGASYDVSAIVTQDMTLTAIWRVTNTVDVTVTVLDPETNEAAVGATVTLNGETVTIGDTADMPKGDLDDSATVVFYDVPEGDHEVVIAMDNKQTVTRPLVIGETSEDSAVTSYMVDYASSTSIEPGLVLNYYMGINTLDVPEGTEADHTEIVTDSINWRYESGVDPYEGATSTAYSLTYDGAIYIETAGTYTFYMQVACAFRLSIDGTMLREQTSDSWTGASSNAATIDLTAGYHTIDLDMFQVAGYAAEGRLYWGTTSTLVPGSVFFQTVPTNVVTYVEPAEAMSVEVGTSFADAAIDVTTCDMILSNGDTATGTITWDEAGFDAACNTAGTYTLYGDLTMPASVENTGDLKATMAVTFQGTAAPAASAAIELADVDVEAGTSTFQLVLESAENVKGVYFTLSDTTAAVEAGDGFAVHQLSAADGVYMLAYEEKSFDQLTGTDIVAATITATGADGVELTISNMVVATAAEEAYATITTATAESTTAFALAKAITAKVDDIKAAQAAFDGLEDTYMSDDWDELTAIFADAITDVEGMTDIADVESYDVAALTAAANAIPTKLDRFDLNNDGYITLADVTCITPYAYHAVTEENAMYDVHVNGSIGSDDYLLVYQNINA